MATYAIGDIHGNYDALTDLLPRAGFDPVSDRLIVLGDVVDYGGGSRKCLDYLLGIPDKVMIMGNHDLWFLEWVATGLENPDWTSQGGAETIADYGTREKVPHSHVTLLGEALPWYEDGDGRIFTHGGFDPEVPVREQPFSTFVWDRRLISYAIRQRVPGYTRIFVGHTPTQQFGKDFPLMFHNVILCDTGARLGQYLSVIDVETLRFWQSDRTDGFCR